MKFVRKFVLFWAAFKQYRKFVCCHTDKDSESVHAATIFLVVHTCHNKVYSGIGQEKNTVHRNHRGWEISNAMHVVFHNPSLIWINVWLKWLENLFSGDSWWFHGFLTGHKILKTLNWLSPLSSPKRMFPWTMKLMMTKWHFSFFNLSLLLNVPPPPH